MRVIHGQLFLEQGDVFPYICPRCGRPIEWHEAKLVVCVRCKFLGLAEEFSDNNFTFYDQTNI